MPLLWFLIRPPVALKSNKCYNCASLMTRHRCRVICFSWFGERHKIYARQKKSCLIATEKDTDLKIMCGGLNIRNDPEISATTKKTTFKDCIFTILIFGGSNWKNGDVCKTGFWDGEDIFQFPVVFFMLDTNIPVPFPDRCQPVRCLPRVFPPQHLQRLVHQESYYSHYSL